MSALGNTSIREGHTKGAPYVQKRQCGRIERFFARRVYFHARAYFMRAACIFMRFEDDNALGRIKPDMNSHETINEYSKTFHYGNVPRIDADELHCFVAGTLTLAGAY